jgi:hypothetical protein
MRAVFAIAVLVSCVMVAPSAQYARAATDVRLERLQQHPLYPMLLSLDRQIAALRATVGNRSLTFAGANAADAAETDRDLAAAATAQRRIAAGAARDRSTEANALAGLARGGDAGGLPAYRAALARTKSTTLAAYAHALDHRTAQAYDLRAAQFAQAESTLAYDLERRDASQTLPLRMKLQVLRPDAGTRAALQRKLNAILARESAAIGALQAEDRSALAAYRASLETAAGSEYATASTEASAREAANLRARANVSLPAAGGLWNEWKALSVGDATTIDASAQAFELQRARSASRVRELAATENDSTRATLQRIAALQARRRALYDEIVRDLCRSRGSGCRA